MKRNKFTGWILITAVAISAGGFGLTCPATAQNAAAPAAAAPAAAAPAADASAPVAFGPTPPAAGVFASHKTGARLHLVVTGHTFTARDQIEMYLAYQAASETISNKNDWFTFVQHRVKGDTVPVPKADPTGPSYSFRMPYFQPSWRYKISGSPAWKTWSPFSGQPFFADGIDPKTITDYEVTADVVMHKGATDAIQPLSFEADSLSDFLINQVQPPK